MLRQKTDVEVQVRALIGLRCYAILGDQYKSRQEDGLYRGYNGQHCIRGIEARQWGPREIDPNPQAEDEKMKVHKTHAAREPGNAIGKPILPAPLMVVGAAPLEQRTDIALDDPGEFGEWSLNWRFREMSHGRALMCNNLRVALLVCTQWWTNEHGPRYSPPPAGNSWGMRIPIEAKIMPIATTVDP